MTKLVAFGDSFTFGSELSDQDDEFHSNLTWSALTAKNLNFEYECMAIGGSSNQGILRSLINYLQYNMKPDCVIAIMWTFTSRFEYHDLKSNDWKNVSSLMEKYDTDVKNFYKIIGNNEINELYTSYLSFLTAQQLLKSKSIPYIFTTADSGLFDRFFSKNNETVYALSQLMDMNNWFFIDTKLGFFDWGHKHFKVGELLHPLDEAHLEFSKKMITKAKRVLVNFPN